MADRTIAVRLRAEMDQFRRSMQDAAKDVDGVGKAADGAGKASKKSSEEAQKAARAFSSPEWQTAGKTLLAIGGSITAIGAAALKTGIEYNTLQQTSRAALRTLTGSAEAANAQMDKLDSFARTSPFAKGVFIEAQQQMLGFGIEAQKVVPYLDAIQNAVAAAGGSNDDIAEISRIMAQISAASKITGTDLMQFSKRGINAAELIGSQMGMTGAQIRESITAGTLDAGAALDALAAGMSERFEGAAEGMKGTFAGAMDRVKATWREFSSMLAEPLVGKEGGGLLTGLLNQVADLGNAFLDLPGPVQTASAYIVGAFGVGSLALGAFIMLAPRILETRQALESLGFAGSKTATIIGRIGRVAGIAAAALAAMEIAGKIGPQSEQVEGVGRFTKALEGLATGGRGAADAVEALSSIDGGRPLFTQSASNISGLSEAIDAVDMNKLESTVNFFNGIGRDTKADNAGKVIEQWDAGLTQLVSSGKTKEAAAAFDYFAKQAANSGLSVEEAAALLPGYSDAILLAADSADDGADAATNFADALREQADAAREAAGSAISQREAQIAFTESVTAANEALANGVQISRDASGAIEETSLATIEADKSLLDIAKSALSWSDAMQDNGVKGEELMGVMEQQRADFIKTATQMGYTKEEAEKLADSYGLIPRDVETEIKVEGQKRAEEAIRSFKALLNSINPFKSVTVGVRMQGVSALTAFEQRYSNANGSVMDFYANGGMRESHVAQIAPAGAWRVWAEPETGGEAYIPLAASKRARSLDIWEETGKRLGVKGFGDGAIADYSRFQAPPASAYGSRSQIGPLTAEVDLSGAVVGLDSDGIARIAGGVVRVAIAQNNLSQEIGVMGG